MEIVAISASEERTGRMLAVSQDVLLDFMQVSRD